MRQAGLGGRGRAVLLGALSVIALANAGTGCGGDGTLVLVTVEGLDAQVVDLGVVVMLDGSVQHPFPRQSVASSLSSSQQFGVLLPAGLGGAVTLEVDGYRGDCEVQSGSVPVALTGEPPILTKVMMGESTSCAPLSLQVQGAGTITSPDAPSISCGPDGQCMYWLDAGRTYTLNATPSSSDVFVGWMVDGVASSCDGQLKCALNLPPAGHQVTAVFNPLCEHQITLTPAAVPGLAAGVALRATWGIANQEAWAVGDLGTVARWRAATGMWDVVALKDKTNGQPVTDTLTAVWGVGSPATLFVGGRMNSSGSAYVLTAPAGVSGTGTVAITASASQNLPAPVSAVTGFDLANVWIAGTGGSALKWNGTTQKFEAPAITGAAPSADFTGAWVSADASHTLATVGDKSQLFVLAGSSWSTITATGGSVKLLAAAGSGDDLYAVGALASVVRLNRSTTTAPAIRKVATGAEATRSLNGVWAGSGYVFAVGDAGSVYCSRTSGAYWTRLPVTGLLSANFLGVYGSGKRLWIVGQNGTMGGVVVEGALP